MGFKKLSNATKNENEFVNSARGETSNVTPKRTMAKRDKKLLVSFTQDEFDRLSEEASQKGLSMNSYARLKIFSKDI